MPNRKILPLLIIVMIILAGCHFPGQPWVQVEITNLEDGTKIVLNEEVRIITQARSSQGISRVELYVNGELESTDKPEMGNPRELIVDLPFIPFTEEQMIVSVLAVDRRGTVSDPFSITLEVVTSIEEIETEPTPTPTVSPEELAQTQTAQASCTNSASFIAHVTIPENTQVSANANFTKIWRVNNNGTCDWAGYQVVHSSGNLMEASSPRALPLVNAGANADIIIDMVAPPTSGNHTAIWRIQSADGTLFGPDLSITINVPDRPTDTPVPTATSTLTPSPTPTPTLTPPPPPTATLTATPTTLPISVQQFSEQISIPPNTTENKTVNCPAGSIVVSGGFSHQAGIRAWQSMKDGNGWRITATNSHTSERNLTVTATCMLNSKGSSSAVSEEKPAKPNDFTQITVNCPAGAIVSGGGWAVENNSNVNVYHSSISVNGWQINVHNPNGNPPKITAYAICLSSVSGTTTQRENTENRVPPNSTASAQMNCPAGSHVTGGGFSMDRELTLFHTAKESNGWINHVANPTGEVKRLDTFTICYQP